MKLLIDADSGIYKAGFSNETRSWAVYGEEGILHRTQYKKDAVQCVRS